MACRKIVNNKRNNVPKEAPMRRSPREIEAGQSGGFGSSAINTQEAQLFTPYYELEFSTEFHPPREALRQHARLNPRR